jgi:hypothetical protein
MGMMHTERDDYRAGCRRFSLPEGASIIAQGAVRAADETLGLQAPTVPVPQGRSILPVDFQEMTFERAESKSAANSLEPF